MQKTNEINSKEKEKPCWFYIDSEPLTSYRESQQKMMSKEISDKEEALRTILKSITHDESYPDNLMINVIHNLSIVDDLRIKRMLFLFWEVIEKTNNTGKIKEEFLLVCNSLRKDLTHPNEYIRGRTLRLLTKLPHVEILESLKNCVFENLNHKHSYVRSNAIMCLISFINNFGVDVLPDSMGEQLKEIVLRDSDVATKRNAYSVLAKIDPKESLVITKEILSSNETNELADLFALAIVENMKNMCQLFPREKSKFIKILIDLSAHKSHSVLFEIGNTLIQLSTNPNTIRSAVNILCNLLVEQKDNNTLIIILRKLIEIKNKFRDILEEQILSFAIILDSNCTNELRKLLFELITELIKESNIARVFDIFITDFNKLKSMTETESTLEYKNMILSCMYKNLKKFPHVQKLYPNFLIDRCLLYDSKNTFLDDQLMIIKDLFYIYAAKNKEENINDFISRIIHNFEDISSAEIIQTCLWILVEYSTDLKTVKKIFDLIMKNIGDLNLNWETSENSEKENAKTSQQEKKVITKTKILADGTYGTETIVVDPTEFNKHREMKYLRKFILETNFFFSTNLVVTISRMVVNLYYLDLDTQETFKTYYYNTINIICAVLKMESDKIFKDPDNISRVSMCLEFLINFDFENFSNWIKESKQIYDEYYYKLLDEKAGTTSRKDHKKVAGVDEFISFRHVKPYDPDNFDTTEEEVATYESDKVKGEIGQNKKFISVLTGSEDPLQIEAVVEIFTFDIVIEFIVKNKTKNELQNVTIDLFAPNNLDIIEKAPSISLAGLAEKKIRSCIKFSSTCNAYIFGQVNYANSKGALSMLNLSGIFIDLLNTYQADISEGNFRKLWVEYNWEHNVILISKKKSFQEVIDTLTQELNLKLIVPSDINSIDEDSVFLVANLYTKSRLGEDALVNISIEKTLDKRIIGSSIIRSKVKDFAMFLGDKIKSVIK